jgi:ATPases involved in chromosome partitioning
MALSSQIGRERALEKALKPIQERYDYILIDTPPSLGLLTINALAASDGVIVPVQCEYLSLRGLVQLERTLEMIRENINPRVKIQGILATLFDARTLHGREAIEILKENFGPLVFKTVVRKTIKFAEAPVQGSSVLKYDPRGKGAEAYRSLAREVLNGKSA